MEILEITSPVNVVYLLRCTAGHAVFAISDTARKCTCGIPWVTVARFVAHEFASGSVIGLPSKPPPAQ